MAENEKKLTGPEQTPKAKPSAAEGKSDLKKACMYIVKAVRAGVLSASLASQAMSTMGCGARTGLPEDEMASVDKGDDDGTVDAGHDGCMAVDAGNEGCMGVDAGGSKPGIDAGGSKPGIDAGSDGSMGIDAGGSAGIDAGPEGSMGIDAGGSKGESDPGGSKGESAG